MLFVSPPFGNYFNLPNTISIKGTYTITPRLGRFQSIIKTLRYSQYYNGWINKIGLKNDGIFSIKKFNNNFVYSIAIINKNDIDIYNKVLEDDTNIEINISCPNVDNNLIYDDLYKLIHPDRNWCIVKLSPICSNKTIDNLYNQGFRQFHCCNTYPVENGGLSGIYLIPFVTDRIKYIKKKYPNTKVIAGGGIRNIETLNHYKKAGADHFSISSLFFNPYLFTKFYINYLNVYTRL
jgi:dihydroorotate dehydrogenase